MNRKAIPVTTKIPEVDDFQDSQLLNLYDINNPDIEFFNLLDEEHIRLSGSEFLYFKYYPGQEDHDEVYLEDKSKAISKQPIVVMGYYEPSVIEEQLSQFNIELTNDQIFTFNRSYIIRRLSRLPIPGDIIKPKFQDVKYKIEEVQEDAFQIYGVYHLVCTANILRDTEEIVDAKEELVPDHPGGYFRK